MKAASIAYALTGLLRAVPFHLRQRRCFLPEDMLATEGISPYALYGGRGLDKLPPVLRGVAKEAVAQAQRSSTRLSSQMSLMYLKQLEKSGYDPLSSVFAAPPPFMALRLWWKNWRAL